MNDREKTAIIHQYLAEIKAKFRTGQALEHAYRPALQRLMESFPYVHAINDPKRSEFGAPDFVFRKKSSPRIVQGYAETKDLDGDLDKVEKTNQMDRYRGYSNLILTNYLEFRFFRNGEKYRTISIGRLKNGKLITAAEQGESLLRELEAFLAQTPEAITSGLRLAQIMGGRARRLRDNITEYLKNDSDKNSELLRIYGMMKELLVHDLQPDSFADMYAQTLVYGLFVARYNDSTAENFTRSDARDLVPKSNPFLLQFFDHIVGPNFDTRLAYIVDELCEIFSVSNVQEIVHKHLRVQEDSVDDRDPIIHFYEDFLQAYDPNERKKMGAYYTPVPIVRYIIRQVDRILKEDFGIAKGIASDEMITQTVATQPYRRPGDRKDRTTTEISVPRVQILDPAVGTATFLNETIKFIYQGFKGQEGRWPAYVNDNLIKRLFGFELMMAPYTIAHLKLGMTLKETGVQELSDRLGIYLTNTLEAGIPLQPDLFNFGLSAAVSEESRLAARVKSEHPVMVVMGNPPYSGESSNRTTFAEKLVDKYRVELGGQKKLQEANYKWLGDDYVKFIAFAEELILKNGEGVLAMITNNGYLQNPTFRGMRWKLTHTFDKIYIVDLHGSAKKREVTPDGGRDENVFDIQLGVAIIVAVKNNRALENGCEIYHAELFGTRSQKFEKLNHDVKWMKIQPAPPLLLFSDRDNSGREEYNNGVKLNEIFTLYSTGILTKNDDVAITFTDSDMWSNVNDFYHLDESQIREKFGIKKDSWEWSVKRAMYDVRSNYSKDCIVSVTYRPFDQRFSYYTCTHRGFMSRSQKKVMSNVFKKENILLISGRQGQAVGLMSWNLIFISDDITDLNVFYRGGGTAFPLYIYNDDGSKAINFEKVGLSSLVKNLKNAFSEVEVVDYVYAILHSPAYRLKFEEFLKSDFPRIPIPTQAEFDRLVPLGRELRELHLMRSPVMDDYQTTFPISGDCLVEKIRYADNKVWINKTQYFGNIPELAWNFYIGGYQPAQKWLKDRKGRQLSDADLVHYQRIIKILLETDRIMKKIG